MWSILYIFLLASAQVATAGSGRGRSSGGGSHSYPHSTGYSGKGLGSHYSATGVSTSHTYPRSGGMSGNTPPQSVQHNTPPQRVQHNTQYNSNPGHKTEVHTHYHYNPPQQISYGSVYHPVYHAAPPVYVYEYRDSGSRFDTLLTGLALYNLGRMSASHHNYDPNREYRSNPGEICKLGIRRSNQDYEETRIDCKLMSSFILDVEPERTKETVVSTKTVTNTVVNVTQGAGSNGNASNSNSTVTTSVTTESKTVDALSVKGPSVTVTPEMTCFMIRISRDTSVLRKKVKCELLQMYAQKSLYYNGCACTTPVMLTVLPFTISLMFSF